MRNLKRFAALLTAAALSLIISAVAFAAESDTGFADVGADAWYAGAAAYCRDNGLMSGTSGTTFSPDTNMTRGMLSTVLYRVAGSPSLENENLGYPFSDVPGDSWYADGVYWARLEGIVGGYGDNQFGHNDPVTREQLAAILWRYSGSPAAEAGEDFADESTIASWAASAVDWAQANGYVNGVGNDRFDPSGTATRAQVAVILMRYTESQTEPAPDPVPTPEPEAGTDVLVAYFSATGNTENIAEHLSDILTADLYEITPQIPYTSADLDYTDASSRSQVEGRDPNARPAISGSVENMEDYEVIFLGYPIWNGQAPRIISTFLESYDFDGKTIVPFCTSSSSGIGSSAQNVEGLISGATWLDGQRFGGDASREAVAQWVDSLELDLSAAEETTMRLTMTVGGQAVSITLLDNPTARSLWSQLPLTLEFEDFNGTEKIAYPPEALFQEDAPDTYDPAAGDVTVYGPWGNLAIFYEDYGNSAGLIPVGHIDAGLDVLIGQDADFTATLEQAA